MSLPNQAFSTSFYTQFDVSDIWKDYSNSIANLEHLSILYFNDVHYKDIVLIELGMDISACHIGTPFSFIIQARDRNIKS